MKILLVIGTRPEAIKMAPVIRRMQNFPDLQMTICSTGQHRDLLQQTLRSFSIIPDIDLDIMQHDQSLNALAAYVLLALDPILSDIRPDWTLVQGDTTSAMAAALAAHNRQLRVAHVEAGLRTYDRRNPFPEETNRGIIAKVSDLHFAPTEQAKFALLSEGIPPGSIHVVGNTVVDALFWARLQPLSTKSRDRLRVSGYDPNRISILVTAHRRENHGQPIRNICKALRCLLAQNPQFQIVFIVHPNPNVWQPVHELLRDVEGMILLEPVDYLTLVYLMQHCRLILTDSGGLQEEGPYLGKPVLVLRNSTERQEAVQHGVARLVGTTPDHIVKEVTRLLTDENLYQSMSRGSSLLGDGTASNRIVDILRTN